VSELFVFLILSSSPFSCFFSFLFFSFLFFSSHTFNDLLLKMFAADNGTYWDRWECNNQTGVATWHKSCGNECSKTCKHTQEMQPNTCYSGDVITYTYDCPSEVFVESDMIVFAYFNSPEDCKSNTNVTTIYADRGLSPCNGMNITTHNYS
jgi:hypothetical protein